MQSKEKALRRAKEKERETLERQQKLDSRGKGKQEKAGVQLLLEDDHYLRKCLEIMLKNKDYKSSFF